MREDSLYRGMQAVRENWTSYAALGLLLVIAVSVVAGLLVRAPPGQQMNRELLILAEDKATLQERLRNIQTDVAIAKQELSTALLEREKLADAEAKVEELKAEKVELTALLKRLALLAASPAVLATKLTTAVEEAILMQRERNESPGLVMARVRDALGAQLTGAVAEFAFSGGPSHFQTLAALVRPALVPLARSRNARLQKIGPLLERPLTEELLTLEAERHTKCMALHASPNSEECKVAESALAGYFGLEQLSEDQEYVLEHLLRRFTKGIADDVQAFALNLIKETAPQQ